MELKLDDLIVRKFTKDLKEGQTVYDLFEWVKRDVVLKNYKTGDILTEFYGVEFPSFYSQNAIDIIVDKYFRRAGVPGTGHETSMKQVAHRLCSFWVESLLDEGMIDNSQADILYDELVYALLSQYFAPNSPQWFNTGIKLAYDIAGKPNNMYYYDIAKRKVVKSKDNYTRTQASACFIVSIVDSLTGPHSIAEQYLTETTLFRGGSGTGTNFSTLRGKGEKLSGGGTSSGAMSFLKGFDTNAGTVKSGGTTRRAAKMVIMDIDHPEIMDFIRWKSKEEQKVRDLIKMGYDGSFDGEAYETVSGQNSNNSIRVSNEFMRKVANLDKEPDATITLKGRKDSKVNREVKVSELWDALTKAAWESADPALQYDDTFNSWHTCPAGEDGKVWAKHNRINATNPCGEYAFLDDTSCNLASINVYKLYKDYEDDGDSFFEHLINITQLALEASIHWGQFPTEDIARRTHLFRTTGLGIANLASLLMVRGVPYNSEKGREIGASIMSMLTGQSYLISALMAKKLGAFEAFPQNKKYMLDVIARHIRAHAVNLGLEGIDVWNLAHEYGRKYGYRNAQVSVIAPTGTIAFAMDCAATSAEPFFSHIAFKKLVGGGSMIIANPIISESLKNLGYEENQIEAIDKYIVDNNGNFEGAPYLKPSHYAVFDTANKNGNGERYISPMGHVKMVAALQNFVSGAISKTVNLPKEATVEEIKDIFLESWKLGTKGITVYRDGSKATQPLNTKLEDGGANFDLEQISYQDLLAYAKKAKVEIDLAKNTVSPEPVRMVGRNKPVGIRFGSTHPAVIDGIKIYTTVNRDGEGKINEVYITTSKTGSLVAGLLNTLSKTISVSLQTGVSPQEIAKSLRGQAFEPSGFVQEHPYIKNVSSIADLVSKILDIECGDYTRVQVKPEVTLNESKTDSRERVNQIVKSFAAEPAILTYASEEGAVTVHNHGTEGEKVYGKTCSHCGSINMRQNGTCMVCVDCGSTTGCS